MNKNKSRFGAALLVAPLSLGWVVAGCGGDLDLGNPNGLDGGVGSDGGAGNDGPSRDDARSQDDGPSGNDSGPRLEAGRGAETGPPAGDASPGNVGNQTTAFQVDLLFDIDNSASMGDKQALLELAIPDLVNRLVNPNCVDANGNTQGPSAAGTCTIAGTTAEFPAVRDMHLGIVSSSLGTRGGDLCFPTQMTNAGTPFLDGNPSIPSHTDDQAHLLGRTAPAGMAPASLETETSSQDVGTQNFLDWFPPSSNANDPTATVGPQALSPALPLTDVATLETDFANLVTGVHAFGCGIESQLESWYRFLIQPDPYASIAPVTSQTPGPGSWVGYDQVIIQQRHDFLRPNSLVAIIVLSDENDSEIDTRSFNGQAVEWMVDGTTTANPDGTTTPAFNPPKGTSVCQTNPGDPACTSCAYQTAATKADPNCATGTSTYTSPVDWGNDVNLRHVHMKQKYGLDRLQYPIQRYYLGLTSPTVPDRTMEYPPGAEFYQGGTAQAGAPGDPSQLNCTNPLFAPALPDGSTSLPNGSDMTPATLCNTAHPATAGRSRGSSLVFFAHIGGVPHQLLQAQPGAADPGTGRVTCPAGTAQTDCPQKDTLAAADWVKILGNGAASSTPSSPPSYDYTGIDPHMIESYQPRTVASGVLPAGVAGLKAFAATSGGGFAAGDPISGNEWVTDTSTSTMGFISPVHVDLPVDREYACIFPLVNPSTGAATPRDCSNPMDYVNQVSCDCSTTGLSASAPSPIPAICGQCTAAACSEGGTDYNLQYYAKAYPTIREIELVHLMGAQGILSSLCPIHPSYAGGSSTDPVFGYRPAMTSIVNRLKEGL